MAFKIELIILVHLTLFHHAIPLYNFYRSSLQMVLCYMVAIKHLPVHHQSVDYIFWSFGITDYILSYPENRVLLNPVLGVVAVLHISLLVMNRLSYIKSTIFISLVYLLLSKDLIFIPYNYSSLARQKCARQTCIPTDKT